MNYSLALPIVSFDRHVSWDTLYTRCSAPQNKIWQDLVLVKNNCCNFDYGYMQKTNIIIFFSDILKLTIFSAFNRPYAQVSFRDSHTGYRRNHPVYI